MATFGQSGTGAGSAPNSSDRYWATKFASFPGGDITKMTAAFGFDGGGSGGGDSCKAVIYADSAGAPGALIGVSTGVAVPAGDQVIDFPLTVTGLAAGTYWLGIVCNGFNSRLSEFATSGGNSVRKESLTYASPANPMGAASATGNLIYTVYATYTPSGGGGSLVVNPLSGKGGSTARPLA